MMVTTGTPTSQMIKALSAGANEHVMKLEILFQADARSAS